MTRTTTTIYWLGALLLVASPAGAHGYHGPRPVPRPMPPPPIHTYSSFKAGGYALDTLDNMDGGMFLGVEWGVCPSPALELGFSLDWFHRNHTQGDAVVIQGPYDLPVQVVTGEGTSTDLIPMGGVMRVRFPMGPLVPFVAGHLTYDLLHLDAHTVSSVGGVEAVLLDSNWYDGLGGGVSAGVQANLAPGFGLIMEAGLHESEPGKHIYVNGYPAEARVNADGEYVRAGMRFAF